MHVLHSSVMVPIYWHSYQIFRGGLVDCVKAQSRRKLEGEIYEIIGTCNHVIQLTLKWIQNVTKICSLYRTADFWSLGQVATDVYPEGEFKFL